MSPTGKRIPSEKEVHRETDMRSCVIIFLFSLVNTYYTAFLTSLFHSPSYLLGYFRANGKRENVNTRNFFFLKRNLADQVERPSFGRHRSRVSFELNL